MKALSVKLFALSAFALVAPPGAHADTLRFNNGDQLTGTLLSQDPDSIRFNSPALGNITVSAAQAHVETTPAASANPAAGRTSAAGAPAANGKPGQPTPPPAPTLGDHLKHLINQVVPGEVSGRFDAGVNNTRATAVTSQIMAVGNLSVKNGANTDDLKGFYYYTATTDSTGAVSRSADRYGFSFTHAHDLSARLFVSNEADYLRDFQANINHQARDRLSVGYSMWKNDQVNLAVQAGPTEQYTDAAGVQDKWFTLGTGKQTLVWKITDLLRLEQEATAAAQPDDLSNHTWKVSGALINKLDRNLELSLRFSQSYNTIIGVKGSRSEQMLALALGMAF